MHHDIKETDRMTKKAILKIVKRTICVIFVVLLLLIAAFTAFVLLNRNTDLSGVRGVNLGSWLDMAEIEIGVMCCQRRCDFVVFRRTGNVEKWRVNVYSL